MEPTEPLESRSPNLAILRSLLLQGFTPSQAAAHLGIRKSTAYNLANTHSLPTNRPPTSRTIHMMEAAYLMGAPIEGIGLYFRLAPCIVERHVSQIPFSRHPRHLNQPPEATHA